MQWISIQEVLAEITSDENAGQTFTLQFVRSSGKRKGSIAIVAKARYGNTRGYKKKNTPTINVGGERREKSLHKEAGTLPLTDTESNTYFTPLISHMLQFNQYKIRH